jgi:hypothetical protein
MEKLRSPNFKPEAPPYTLMNGAFQGGSGMVSRL